MNGATDKPAEKPDASVDEQPAMNADESSPVLEQLQQDMGEAIAGIEKSARDAAAALPHIKAKHDELQGKLATAYAANDFETYNQVGDDLHELEKLWQATLHTVGPEPERFGLPEHPTLVDPDG